MRYRIKITTYASGRKAYMAQYKRKFFGWVGLNYDGSDWVGYEWDDRTTALSCIDKHFAGNTKSQTIEFEYIKIS